MPKKMKPVVVRAYSRMRGEELLRSADGQVDGATIDTCHPSWHKQCVKEKSCINFFSDGCIPRKRELAKLMKKPESKVAPGDMYNECEKFKKRAFRRCRLVKIVATD